MKHLYKLFFPYFSFHAQHVPHLNFTCLFFSEFRMNDIRAISDLSPQLQVEFRRVNIRCEATSTDNIVRPRPVALGRSFGWSVDRSVIIS